MARSKSPVKCKKRWSPLEGLTPNGKKVLRKSLKDYAKRDAFFAALLKSAMQVDKVATAKLDRITPIFDAHLRLRDRSPVTQHYIEVANEMNAALILKLSAVHMLSTASVLRHNESQLMYLEIVALHAVQSTKKGQGEGLAGGLTSLLGEHGLRLHSAEEKFEDFERRVSGTLGDLYSRLSAGQKLESER